MHKLHSIWGRFQSLSLWSLLVAAVVFGTLAVHGLRQNNLTMVRLRDEVIKADENGTDVEAPLRRLREHVHAHMNTNVASGPFAIKPPIQLKSHYERLLSAERARVTAVNAKVYSEAQADCERRFPAGQSGSGRIPCVEQYVAVNGVKEQPIPDSLYKFDFLSPSWSPDLAGISLALSGLFLGLFIIRFIIARNLHRRLRANL